MKFRPVILLEGLRALNRYLVAHGDILRAWAALISIVGVPLLLLGGALTVLQVREYFRRPELALEFATPAKPTVRVVNVSKSLVREAGYQLGLWDLDAALAPGGDDTRTLKIPGESVGYVRAGDSIGPWRIEDLAKANVPIPDGHVIFGAATVKCPDCIRRRQYWVYFRKGGSGWFAEMSPEEEETAGSRLASVLSAGKTYPSAIERAVPRDRRVPLE